MGAKLLEATGCVTVNKMCGSGMKALMLGHDALRAGSARAVVAGGMESMSNAPYLLDRARSGYRMGHGKLVDHMFFIIASLSGDTLALTSIKPRENGRGEDRAEFSGRREPPMPPAPDMAQVKFGEAIQLFNGKDLTGWRLTDANAFNGWSVKNGLLVNEVSQEEGKPHKNSGNLRTDQVFEDFNLTLEVRVPKDGNSGVYIRGIYECQVVDSYGKPLDPHNMGAIYSRIKPTVNAEKPAGEWQTMDITFVDRHVTVVLNGKKIIDNQPIPGCTGGALWSDVLRPGPIYLQGDHTGIEYRNIVLKPVVK